MPQVYLSHNFPTKLLPIFADNTEQVAGVVAVSDVCKNAFVLKDAKQVEADAIIYCTGE